MTITKVQHKTGKERAQRPVWDAGKDYGLECKNSNPSGKPFWGPWGAPDEYSYGQSDSKFFLPTGSVHDGGWVQNVSWKGRCAREELIRNNKEISMIDGTDQERIEKMRRFVRHDGASRDSQRKMMDTYGGAVLKQEQELTRNGYNRTALGGFFKPGLNSARELGMSHRAKTSNSWVQGVEGPMASQLLLLKEHGYGAPKKPKSAFDTTKEVDNFYVKSRAGRREHESLATPLDSRAQSPLFPDGTPRTEIAGSILSGSKRSGMSGSMFSGSSYYTGMSYESRRSRARSQMSGVSGVSKAGSSKSQFAPMPIQALHTDPAPLSRRNKKTFGNWNGYFADR